MSWLDYISEIDKEIFLFLNSFYSDYWDMVMMLLTRKETWVLLYITIIWFVFRNFRSKGFIVLFFLLLMVVASDQLSVFVKDTVQRLRPTHDPAFSHMVHYVVQKGGLYGFVSSHAANSFALFVFSARIFKNKTYSWLMFFWAILISYTRIYTGVHFPLDILGGAVLGSFIGWIMYKLMMFTENHFFIARPPSIKKTKLQNNQLQIIALVLFLIIAVILLSVSLLFKSNCLT